MIIVTIFFYSVILLLENFEARGEIKKSTSTWLNIWTTWTKNNNFETNLPADKAKKIDENEQMLLHD